MKTRIYVITVLLLLINYCAIGNQTGGNTLSSTTETVTIHVSPDLYNLLEDWTTTYQQQNSSIHISLKKFSEQELTEVIHMGNSVFVTGDQLANFSTNTFWNLTLARNVVVPVMYENNADKAMILSHGIPEEELIGGLKSGSDLSSGKSGFQKCYIVDDPTVRSVLKSYTENGSSNNSQLFSGNIEEVIIALKQNPHAIAFCNLAQIINYENNTLKYGLQLVPIDRNANGKLDYMEDIYQNLQAFGRGVWLGKYPKTFTSGIYLVSETKPVNKAEEDFIKWIVTTGQQKVLAYGYCDLSYNEQLAQLAKFDEPAEMAKIQVTKANNLMSVLLMIIAFIVFGGALVEFAFVRFSKKTVTRKANTSISLGVFDENTVSVPLGIYFDKSHSWAFMKKNGVVKVGIDDFLQHITGIISRVEMRSAGDKIKKGDRLITICQKGKQIHVYSPVSGTITEVNEKLKTDSTLINNYPYSDGWVYSIEPLNWNLELQYLLMADSFKIGLAEEFRRLKDFFASVLKPYSPDVAHAILQDGGSLIDHPLSDLGPDVWDDFQTEFIDASK